MIDTLILIGNNDFVSRNLLAKTQTKNNGELA